MKSKTTDTCKAIVISGGSGGLGRATAEYFAARGYTVFSLDIKKNGRFDENIIEIETDLCDSGSVERAKEAVNAAVSGVCAVVSLAGIYFMDSLIEVSEAELRRIIEVNVLGVYRLNRAFLPLVRNGNGRIIVTTSELAGMKALPFNGIYSLTKTALEHYTDSLRQELNLLSVPVIEIMPGAFDTTLVGSSFASLDRMSEKTLLYKTNTARFRRIMQTQSGSAKPPERLARVIFKAGTARRPKLRYRPNNNPLLGLYNLIPRRAQLALIGRLIKR